MRTFEKQDSGCHLENLWDAAFYIGCKLIRGSVSEDYEVRYVSEQRLVICKITFLVENKVEYESLSIPDTVTTGRELLMCLRVQSSRIPSVFHISPEALAELDSLLKESKPNPDHEYFFSFPLDMENLADASEWHNKRHVFFVFPKDENGLRLVINGNVDSNCSDQELDHNSFNSKDFLKLSDDDLYMSLFRTIQNMKQGIIDRLPSRSVFVSGREYSYRSGGFTNTISLFAPSETAESCLLYLRTYEAVLAPYPQGFFEGYTFKKYIYAPKEEYYWSDEQLIEKYESIFESKSHNK